MDLYIETRIYIKKGFSNVDKKLVGKRIEVLRKYFDEVGEVLDVWENGDVIAIPVMKEKKHQQKYMSNRKKER